MVSDVRITIYFPYKIENGVFRHLVQSLPKHSFTLKTPYDFKDQA